MAKVNVNFEMDQHLKEDMETVCAKLGMSTETVFTMFAEQMVREGRIPFEEEDIPNEVTRQAIMDARLNTENMSREFATVKEMMEELNK